MRSAQILRQAGLLVLSMFLPALAGCGQLGYAFDAVLGEIDLLTSRVPIPTALADPDLTDEQRQKLAFIERARVYAREVIALDPGGSYQDFVLLEEETLAWNLSASSKVAFQPYYWTIPVVGALPYLGYFDLAEAEAERDALVEAGYDTVIYPVDAYSTLGVLPDPVASPLLERDYGGLADIVMHEILHNTVWRDGDTTFNESMAMFVGRTAGLQFLAHEFGEDSRMVTRAMGNYEDEDRFIEFLFDLRAELSVLYASSATRDEKLTAREVIFDAARQRFADEVLPQMHNAEAYQPYADYNFNNAFLLLYARYNSNLETFAAVHEATGRDWPLTIAHFQDAAGSDSPFAYLQSLVEE